MRERNSAIDFWKFVCAFYLLFYHFEQVFGIESFGVNLMGSLNFNIVVEWFFLLSGFMITRSDTRYFKNATVTRPEEKRFLHRFFRVYPMFFIATCTGALVMYTFRALTGTWWWNGMPHGIYNLILSLLCQTYTGIFQADYILGINSPTWFIDGLILCYALFYLVHFIARRTGISACWFHVLLALLGWYAYFNDLMLPFWNRELGRGYAAFFLGCVLWRVKAQFREPQLKRFTGVAILILLLARWLDPSEMIDNDYFIRAFVLGTLLLFLCVSFDGPSRFFGLFPFVKDLGSASFEVFLWHIPVLNFLDLIWHLQGKTVYSSIDAVIFAAVTEVFAMLMYLFVEKKVTRRMPY